MAEVRQIEVSRYRALRSDRVLLQAFWIVTFAVLTAVGAQIEIPYQPVPFTMQTLFVLLAGGMLGWRNGMLSMVVYITMGSVGMPVFSGGGFGLARLLGPTGGYLLSFPVAAAVIGALLDLRTRLVPRSDRTLVRFLADYGWTTISMTAGLAVIFLAGTAQLYAVLTHDWTSAFQGGFLVFSAWDLLKLVAAIAISREFRR